KRVAIVGQDTLIPNLNCGDECNDRTVMIGRGSGSNSLLFMVPPITALNGTFTAAGAVVTTSLMNDLTAGAKVRMWLSVVGCSMSAKLGLYQSVDGNEADWNDLELWFNGSIFVCFNVAAVGNSTIVVVSWMAP
ncbi:hypothetical protein C8R46DRAFT_1245638, partial [Mycena filopes]